MVLNSFSFLVFFSIVFLLYYIIFKSNSKTQNLLILIASYVFYGIVDLTMIPLLFVSTGITYALGLKIHQTTDERMSTIYTNIGVVLAIGMLVYFKYFNFFIDSFNQTFQAIGLKSNIGTFNILMPLGISFFTFKLISYLIDINRGKIEPTRDFINYAAFIAFFPTILSGPIDKPHLFIPQLEKKRNFNYVLITDGLKQILWGLALKMIIADNLAVTVNAVWADLDNQNGVILLITAVLYSFQLYTDFAGYSSMAIGVGKVFGITISKNFDQPFFARNLAEYWRKWHMSLTSWLTDYIFMPLNIKFRDLGNNGIILAILINMFVVGMWHGANWTFAVFGIYHGLLFIPLIRSGAFFKKKRLKPNKHNLPVFSDVKKMIGTFLLVTLGLVIFRAPDVSTLAKYIINIFDISAITFNSLQGLGFATSIYAILLTIVLIIVEWKTRKQEHGLAHFGVSWNSPWRYVVYYALILAIFWFGGGEQQFLYTQY